MKKLGFSRAMRVTKQREFEALYEEGLRLRGESLTLIARPNALGHARLGISVGKKKMRRAVDRNRFKRLVREAFRLNRERLPAETDLLVIPNRSERYTLDAIVAEMIQLAERAQKRLAR